MAPSNSGYHESHVDRAAQGVPKYPSGADESSVVKPYISTIIALAGTFCAPRIFARLGAMVGDGYDLQALSWMTDAPAWSIDALAEWVERVIDEKSLKKVLLVGHSTGGAIAMRLAGRRPDVVGGLMLVNTGPNMDNHGDVLRLIADIEQNRMPDAVRAVLQRSFDIKPSPEDMQSLLDYGLVVPLRAALEVLRSQYSTDLLPSLRSVQVPVTVVHGARDHVRSISEARLMADSVPNGSLVLANCGHSPMYEMPEIVAAAVHQLNRRSNLYLTAPQPPAVSAVSHTTRAIHP